MKQIAILSGNSNPKLVHDIVAKLNILRRQHSRDYSNELHLIDTGIKHFADGEVYCSINESIRGAETFIIQSTCPPVNDNFMELLLLIDAAKRASAGHITAVIPYFGYARQDRKNARRDPISARLIANLLETAGANRILTLDLHAKQIQGFFNIPVDNLSSAPIFIEYWKCLLYPIKDNPIVVSPDVGGVLRARSFAEKAKIDQIAIVDKRRRTANECEIMHVIGDVEGKTCILYDDIIDTAGTLCKAATALKNSGAKEVIAFASHGVLSNDAIPRINSSPLSGVYLLSTIPPSPHFTDTKFFEKIAYLSCAKLFAEAIDNIYRDTSFDTIENLF